MFEDIDRLMDGGWIWQQDGDKLHRATETINWLKRNTADMILPSEWPSKSPDLNVMNFCVWSLLPARLQLMRTQE